MNYYDNHLPGTPCTPECVHDYEGEEMDDWPGEVGVCDCANLAPEDSPHTDEDHDNLEGTT